MGGRSKSSTSSQTNYTNDSRSYGADDGSVAAGGNVSIKTVDEDVVNDALDVVSASNHDAFAAGQDALDVVSSSNHDALAVVGDSNHDAFAAGQMMFDRALDSVDVLTDAYGQTMVQREKSAGDSVRLANDAAVNAINAAQPESEKTIMYLAGAGGLALVLIAFAARGK